MGTRRRRRSAALVLVAGHPGHGSSSCLVAAAGFVVVAQRRQRQLGLLAAIGATDRHLRLVMLANGVVVGRRRRGGRRRRSAFVGWIVAGAARSKRPAGTGSTASTLPWWLIGAGHGARRGHRDGGGLVAGPDRGPRPVMLALSARRPGPSRSTARSLARRAVPRPRLRRPRGRLDPRRDDANAAAAHRRHRWPSSSGSCFASPLAIRALAAVAAAGLPFAARLALRDLARHQARSAAALAAISLGLGIAVAIVVIATAAEPAADEGNLSDRQLLVRIGDEEQVISRNGRPPSSPELAGGGRPVRRHPRRPRRRPPRRGREPRRSRGHERPGRATRRHLGRARRARQHRDAGPLYVATPALLDHLGIDLASVGRDTSSSPRAPGDLRFVNLSNDQGRRGPAEPRRPRLADRRPRLHLGPESLIPPEEVVGGVGRRPAAAWLVESEAPLAAADLARARSMAAASGHDRSRRGRRTGWPPPARWPPRPASSWPSASWP